MNGQPLQSLDINAARIFAEAVPMIEAVPQWHADKVFPCTLVDKTEVQVATYHAKVAGAHWCARITPTETWTPQQRTELWQNLDRYLVGEFDPVRNLHTHHEQKYIEDLEHLSVQPLPPQEAPAGYDAFAYTTQVVYRLQFPLSKRVFNEVVIVYRSHGGAGPKRAYIVTFPIAPRLFVGGEEANRTHVVATYSSVEEVVYDPATTALRWTMATTASPNGFVPNFVANMGMNPAVAKDVPSFMNWLKQQS